MASRLAKRTRDVVAYARRVAGAHGRAAFHRTLLAPGRLRLWDHRDATDPGFLLDCAAAYGPIFRIWSTGEVTTCIVGNATGRRFLSESLEHSQPFTIDTRPLFPHGTLRAMQGDLHRAYRRSFVQALRATPLDPHHEALVAAIRAGLDRLAAAPGQATAGALRATAKDIATILLLRLLLGVTEESPAYRLLPEQLERFGPDGGPIDEVDRAAVRSFAELRSTVLAEIDRRNNSHATEAPSVLGHMQAAGTLDETLLGNLIQSLQTGRYDLTGLLSWLLHFLAGAPEVLERIRKGGDSDGGGHSLATAAVLETLRLAQSEYLRRRVSKSIVFDSFLIPRGSLVRICILEGHRDPVNFADPTAFLPERFLGKEYPPTSYAPFGLDHHRCAGADLTIDIGTMFAEILARDYRLRLASAGPPIGGHHHFEPGPGFAVCLDRLTADELTATRT